MKLSGDRQSIDFLFLMTVLILAGVGLVIVYSSSSYMSMDRMGDSSYYFRRQAIRMLVGIVVMFVLTKLNYRGWANLSAVLVTACYAALLMLLVQKAIYGIGVHRWLRLGPVGFQPSEFMKVAGVIFLAATIAGMGERVRDFKRGFLPLLGFIGATFVLIVAEPDLGTAGLIMMTGFYMLFLGRAKLSHLLLVTAPAGMVIALIVKTVPYMQRRWELFLNPELGYQVSQSIIGIGSGGIFGVGLGNSTQKFLFLPENHTDFVFSIMAEEFGFVGTTVVLVLTLFYVIRGLKIAQQAPDMFGFLLGSGLSVMVGMQVFINIGVASGMLPTTGMTLPFISYGGSSLILTFIATGILLNISKQGRYEKRLSREFGARLTRRTVPV